MHVIDTLIARGFVQQSTGLDRLRAAMDEGSLTFYIGFDPTADSLHVGHLVQIMAMRRIQEGGNRAIAIVGGGTARVGDPSGKTEMRKMLTTEVLDANVLAVKGQLSRFVDLDGTRGILVNNADWLLELKYIDFLRDIGRHFSVNRMLAAEAYKARLERGLSFIEFNYQILQAYDFLELNRRYGCALQVGGDDQWGNILAGTDLVRRLEQADVHGMTTPLITTSSGAKMGKTASGAVWLDPNRTSPFDYYQFWVNTDDRDVGRFLRLFTDVPLDEITQLEALEGADVRQAKARLALEATAMVHGVEAAEEARSGAQAMVAGQATEDMPTLAVDRAELQAGIRVYVLLNRAEITKSNGEGRRLIQGGGVKLDNDRVGDPEADLTAAQLGPEGAVLRVGKKRAIRVVPA